VGILKEYCRNATRRIAARIQQECCRNRSERSRLKGVRGTLPPKILAESIEKQGETTAFFLLVVEAEIRTTELENWTFFMKN